jgi:hypothetical protein
MDIQFKKTSTVIQYTNIGFHLLIYLFIYLFIYGSFDYPVTNFDM